MSGDFCEGLRVLYREKRWTSLFPLFLEGKGPLCERGNKTGHPTKFHLTERDVHDALS